MSHVHVCLEVTGALEMQLTQVVVLAICIEIH